jgi:hypothetical protein
MRPGAIGAEAALGAQLEPTPIEARLSDGSRLAAADGVGGRAAITKLRPDGASDLLSELFAGPGLKVTSRAPADGARAAIGKLEAEGGRRSLRP